MSKNHIQLLSLFIAPSVGVAKMYLPATFEKSPTILVVTFSVFPEKSPTNILMSAGKGSVSTAGSIERTNFVAAFKSSMSTVNDYGKVTFEKVPVLTGLPFTIIQPS